MKNPCPKCGMYRVISLRSVMIFSGLVLATLFSFFIVTIPLGIGMMIYGAYSNKMMCNNCKYTFSK